MALLLTLSFGAASSLAASGYAPDSEFGSGSLGNVPTDVAVDDTTGHVLVVDSENNRVVIFASGEPGAAVLTTFGEGELSAPYGIAIDETNGDVYISDAGNNRIVRYTSDGAPVPTYTLDLGYTSPTHGAAAAQVGSFASPLAIDPSTGNLLVADRGNLRVERFDAGGGFVSSFDGSTAPSGAFTSLLDIATGPDGTIYLIADSAVESYGGFVTGSVVESFAADGSLIEVMRGASGDPAELSEANSIAYDTRLEHVLVTSGGNRNEGAVIALHVLQGGQQVGQVAIPTGAQGTLPVAIAVPGAQLLPLSILTAKIFEGGAGIAGVLAVKSVTVDLTFSPVSAITGSGAHLAGTVNPHGDSGSAQFEYRRVGSESWTVAAEHSVSAESAAEPVEEDLAELLPNETYEVRLTAGIAGFTTSSSVSQFQTVAIAPVVLTQEATGISGTGATLNGSVNPSGTASTWFFEYGATAAYGARIPLAAAPAGAGQAPVSFSRAIGGLTAGSTYHFRIVAENAAGVSYGADRTLVPSTEVRRAYEEVTPVDQGGVFPDPKNGPLALSGTSGITYINRPAGNGAASAPYHPRMLVLRGASDWSAPKSLDPKIRRPDVNRADGSYALLFKLTLGVSADGTHTFIVTNEKLTPDALEGSEAANLYVEDLRDSSLRLVAATNAPGAFDQYTAGGTWETFVAGADDFSWVVFYSAAPLKSGVTHTAVYRWTSAGLEVMSTLPGGSLPSADVDPQANFSIDRVKRWVSADGSTLLFGLVGGPVYVRHGSTTVAASVSQIDGEPKPAQMIATNSDGRYAYFVSGALTPGVPEANDIYRFARETNSVEYVGTFAAFSAEGANAGLAVSADGSSIAFLGRGELKIWHDGEVKVVEPTGAFPFYAEYTLAQFSPNGRYFAYGYQGDVYLYDLSSNELSCVSCRAGRPTAGAALPPGPEPERLVSNSLPRGVDDQGRVFFTSEAALTPADTNGERDVYMFDGGRVSLISPGNGPYAAIVMDISPDGQDVYFTTDQPLVARDTNREPDIYDARVGGGFAAQNQAPAPPCEGEACQGPWHGAPAVAPLSSEALTGVNFGSGNTNSAPTKPKPLTRAQKLTRALKACHAKRDRHRRQICEKTARKRFGAKPKAKAKSHKGGK